MILTRAFSLLYFSSSFSLIQIVESERFKVEAIRKRVFFIQSKASVLPFWR